MAQDSQMVLQTGKQPRLHVRHLSLARHRLLLALAQVQDPWTRTAAWKWWVQVASPGATKSFLTEVGDQFIDSVDSSRSRGPSKFGSN